MANKYDHSFSKLAAQAVSLACVGLLGLLLSACGGGTSGQISGSAQISLNPASVGFGNVAVGTTSSLSVALTDSGTSSLSVSQVTVTGAAFSITGLSVPLTVAAGQSTTFRVTFAPTTAGNATGSISVVSNASNSPASVSLTGSGVTSAGLLTVKPTSIDFGNVAVGSSSTLAATLNNTGSTSVTVSKANVSGTGFSVSGLSLPLTLAAGKSASLSVVFAPASTGSASGSISIVSDASNSPASITLSGSGVQSVAHSATLTWTASTSTVSGYNAYRGTVSGGPYSKLNSALIGGTTYTDNTVQAGQTYYWVATAVDANNVESSFSNQASATVPTP